MKRRFHFLSDEVKDAIRRVAAANPELSERALAERFACSQPTIHAHLVAAGLQRPKVKAKRPA